MQLKSLRLFLDVVETGSFISAAEKRHTVQSNVTAHIKKLEQELNTILFHRKGGAKLTTSGQAVLDYAKRILGAHDEVINLFNTDLVTAGQLRLGAMETTTALRLPPLLTTFHQQNPHVNLTVETGPTAQLTQRLLARDFDGVFIAGRLQHNELHQLKVFSETLVLVAAKPFKQFPSPEQFLAKAFLAFRQGCSYRQRIELLLSSCGVSATRVFEFGSIDGILGCVAAGMGYTLMPKSVVESHKDRFAIDYLEIPPTIGEVDTYFTTAQPTTWTAALSQFVGLLPQSDNDTNHQSHILSAATSEPSIHV